VAGHGISFIPGQVAMLRVMAKSRPTLLLPAPGRSGVGILVKRTIGASVLIYEMERGTQVDLLGVAGRGFLWRADREGPVFVAMGTGVAPLRSVLRHVLQRKQDFGRLVVLYGARTPDDFCYRDETEAWKRQASNYAR